jgi:putative hydrolase of the HAD superfamily
MIQHILFDLDDTLYPTSAGMMREIDVRMNEFMVTQLGFAPEDVARWRKFYWETYGTTLRGLYLERHIAPQAFLNFVHDVDVQKYLHPDEKLEAMLAQLPQRKSVFTNAPADYARRVLRALGVEKYFAEIFDINFIRYESKPTPTAYDRVLAALPVRADECLMIDDATRNLAPAKKLGMTTVWLDGNSATQSQPSDAVDFTIKSIYELAQVVSQ